MRNFQKKYFEGEGGIRILLGIALPMIVSSAAETVMMFVDRLFLSRLGPVHLAASLGGGFTAFMALTFFFGVIGYGNALVAQHYGAGQPERCGRAGAQALILAAVSYPIILLSLPLVSAAFDWFGHSAEQVALERAYFRILAWGSVLSLMRTALSSFFCGIGRTRIVMVANTAAMAINIPANYGLIFGNFGLPALGIEGAACGTILGSLCGLCILAAAYAAPSMRRAFATLSGLRYDRDMMGRLLRFGLPSGIEFFLNMSAFNLFVLLFHGYGPDAAAAISITLNWDLMAFLPLIGLSQAVTSLAGRYIGSGRPALVRRSAFSGLTSCGLYCLAMSLLFVLSPGPLVAMFAVGSSPEQYAAVVPMAILMLRLAALYTIVDGAFVIFDGALRGVGDTHWTMKATVTLHWIMAFSALLLIKVLAVPPIVAWLAFIAFVLVLATLLAVRFLGEKWRELDVMQPPSTAPTVVADAGAVAPPDIR